MARLKVTPDDLDNLTEEELAGMKELQAEEEAERLADVEENGEEEPAVEKAAAPPEKPETPEKPAEKVEEPPAETEADEEEEDEDEAEGDEDEGEGEAGEGEGEGDGDGEAKPQAPAHAKPYQVTAEEIARLEAVEKLLDEIAEKFDDGELTAREMRDQSKTLQKELDDLKDKRTIAKMHGADASNRWYGQTIPAFLADHTEYVKGSLRFDLLDTTVKTLQAASDDPTDPAILVAAHKKITDEFGPAAGAKAEKPAKKANGNGRTIPPTLSGVPAADISETAHKSEFGHLDKLKGVALERAEAKLRQTSPESYERYLQGG